MQFVTSRSEALDKLNKYLESDISNYNTKRNFDFGVADRRNVSCLSPYITHRLITEYETALSKITQHLSFIRNPNTQVEDTALIEYIIQNTSSSTQNIGLRIMLDTKLGSNDGAPFRMGPAAIVNEQEFDQENLYLEK